MPREEKKRSEIEVQLKGATPIRRRGVQRLQPFQIVDAVVSLVDSATKRIGVSRRHLRTHSRELALELAVGDDAFDVKVIRARLIVASGEAPEEAAHGVQTPADGYKKLTADPL